MRPCSVWATPCPSGLLLKPNHGPQYSLRSRRRARSAERRRFRDPAVCTIFPKQRYFIVDAAARRRLMSSPPAVDTDVDQQQIDNGACEPCQRIHPRRSHGAVLAVASHRQASPCPVPATISFSPTSLTITQPGTSQKLLLALSHSVPCGQDGNPVGRWSGRDGSANFVEPECGCSGRRPWIYIRTAVRSQPSWCWCGMAPGTAVIRASAPPFIPAIMASVTVLP